ncbi:MAG: NAD-dependent protein deacylase [Ignavibacteria bacterium]|nr:NAD-dependent protein deacylase [Ignavibacteria bacterium]
MEIPHILIEKLASAKHVAVLTGAGVSAESGIKTFRDPDGLWAQFNPAELASMDGFMSNPDLVWSWYQHRREIVAESKPNPGHYAIAEMQNLFEKFTLITQNVDRLHQSAGSKQVLELHGNIIENHCVRCKKDFVGETTLPDGQLPKCSYCGGMIRPSVVWFGEMLPADTLLAAENASNQCDFFFTVGTSGEVYPAANLPIVAKRHGAYVVEVNPNRTSISHSMDCCLSAPSGVALPLILNEFKKYRNQKS